MRMDGKSGVVASGPPGANERLFLLLIRLTSVRPQAVLLAVVLSVLPVTGADFIMKVTDRHRRSGRLGSGR